MTGSVYQVSSIRRHRRTAAEMNVIRAAIMEVAKGGTGMTVRHVFYRLVAAGIVAKSELGSKTLVVAASLRTYVANLQHAEFRTGQHKPAA